MIQNGERDDRSAPLEPLPRSWPRSLLVNAVRLALPLLVLAIMWSSGWSSVEFGRHPDEAGHFVTGILVHDWLTSGSLSDPLEFARQFHARYPKVAIGHWPPLFYAIQAVWYSGFGVSRESALALTLLIASGYLLVLFELLRRRVGLIGAIAAVGFVLASPVFRYACSTFMSDILLSLTGLAAVWAFVIYLEHGKTWAAVAFAALLPTALLIKQDAAALAITPAVVLLVTRRWELLKDWRFYLSAASIAIACVPVYYVMSQTSVSAFNSLAGPSFWAKLESMGRGLSLTGLGGLAITVLGVIAVVAAKNQRRNTLGIVLAARALSYIAVQLATPVSLDPRYRIALIGVTAFLWAVAFQTVADLKLKPTARALILIALGLLAWSDPPQYQDPRVNGYRDLVAELKPAQGLQTVLVCSDTMGDGALVSEFRLQRPQGAFCVLRADKALAAATWMGKDYRLKFATPQSIETYLRDQPVHWIVLDHWEPDPSDHADLLAQTIEAHPDRYALVNSYPIVRSRLGQRTTGQARLYRVVANQGRYPKSIEIDMPNTPGGVIRIEAGRL